MSDRKYKQRGYMESDRPAGPREGPRDGPPARPEGPRGRGLGAPVEAVFRCGECGRRIADLPADGPALGAVCPHCGAPLHSCSNCAHFEPAAPKECRQSIPERIPRKRGANECSFFAGKQVREFAAEPARPPEDDPRSAFDALFKR